MNLTRLIPIPHNQSGYVLRAKREHLELSLSFIPSADISTLAARAREENRADKERCDKKLEESNMTDTVTTTVEVASPNGQETFQLTRDQTMNLVEERGGNTWVFASGQLVQPAQLADTDWETVGTVRITPGLVGGFC